MMVVLKNIVRMLRGFPVIISIRKKDLNWSTEEKYSSTVESAERYS